MTGKNRCRLQLPPCSPVKSCRSFRLRANRHLDLTDCFVGNDLNDILQKNGKVGKQKMNHVREDERLVQQVLSGDRKAFERLVRQYEALVLHIVHPMIGNTADREDLCQEIFIRVYQRLHGFEFRSRLSTWIGTIAYNTCINFLQKKRNVLVGDLFGATETVVETLYTNSPPTPEDLSIKKQELKHLTYAIEKLPGVQKTVLLLFHHDDLSLDEITQILGIPLNTVKSHLFRARKNLKTILTNIEAT